MMDKCQFCGKPAVVHMTQIVNNKTTVIHMCSECAAKHGLFGKEGLPFALLSNLGEALFSGIKKGSTVNGLICSKCGCTPMAFKETGRLGCPHCYEDLKPLVDGIVESSQKGPVHRGKVPKNRTRVEIEKILTTEPTDDGASRPEKSRKSKKSGTHKSKIEELRAMLDEAIKMEHYEEAARLRDEIAELKKTKEVGE
ncbi:MAG: UvrB/UvrC motif-containing protein [Puniceicoccales bacterium]|jgi:protein arginine kinase activator|nr:UvrB/UvrC motif-containing protein [Puniceicoccales bacterium]